MNPLRNHPTSLLLALLLLLTLPPLPGTAQECGFGPRGFGGIRTGTSFTDAARFSEEIFDVAVQPDGRIVAVGEAGGDFLIARFDRYGIPDTTFGGGDGAVVVDLDGRPDTGFYNDRANAVAILPNGRIVVAGYGGRGRDFDYALIALTRDGSLDPAFGRGGVFFHGTNESEYLYSISVDPTGGFWVGGQVLDEGLIRNDWDVTFWKHHDDGSLDNSFDDNGGKKIAMGDEEITGMVRALSNGKVMVCGQGHAAFGNRSFFVHRFHPSGAPDSSLGTAGHVSLTYRHGEGVVKDFIAFNDGSFCILTPKAVYAFDFRGAPVSRFGNGGVALIDGSDGRQNRAESFVRLPTGEFVIAGTATIGWEDFAVTRLTSSGRRSRRLRRRRLRSFVSGEPALRIRGIPRFHEPSTEVLPRSSRSPKNPAQGGPNS